MNAYVDASDEAKAATWDYIWIKADDTAGRRSRASQITAKARAFARKHRVTLELVARSYDETPGFLHRSAFRYRVTPLPEEVRNVTVTTNWVPRDVIQAWELTEAERAEFDYHDWAKIEEGEDSAEFFRFRGELYDLGEFSADWGITRGTGLPRWATGWAGYTSDSFFSGMLVRWPVLEPANRYHDTEYDWERIIVGTFYVR